MGFLVFCLTGANKSAWPGNFTSIFGYSLDINALPVVVLVLRQIRQEMFNGFMMKSVEDCIKKHSRKN